MGGDELTFRVTSAETGGALLAVEVRIPAGGGPPMLHRHAPAEVYRVERRELAVYVDDDVVFAPGAGIERFMRDAGELAAPDPAAVVALAERHGIEMTRPVPAPR